MLTSHKGSSFIEILISLLLISSLAIGMDMMQVNALRKSLSSYYFAIATQQLANITEKLSVYHSTDLSDLIEHWNQQNQIVLPQGKGSINGIFPNSEAVIFWGGANEENCHATKAEKTGCVHIRL